MCGFVCTVIPRSGHRLSHRGPSALGASGITLPWAHVTMEMSRLAVVDQRDIAVPFDFRASCGVLLAYNGEIYNWRELRAELSNGRPWETECDAEVLARAWRRWGAECLGRLNGMFSFVLVDTLEEVVFAARDRAGEKPLYYAHVGTGWAFASEIKALPVVLEEAPCETLEALEFDCTERTPFVGVHALSPGHYVRLSDAGLIRCFETRQWWAWPMGECNQTMRGPDAEDELLSLVTDAIQIRASAEVPVALQLSGGLDSAIVQAVAGCQRLYTVEFGGDGIDNLTPARIAAQGGIPKAVRFTYEDMLRAFSKIAWHLDTPATWTAVCQWFMNQQIHDDGAVVVLSGEGADELFGGYARYRVLWGLDLPARDPVLREYGPLLGRCIGTTNEVMTRMLCRGSSREHHATAADLIARFGGLSASSVDVMQRVDFYTTMQVLLRMADRMSAAFGMENRCPFLDYRIMEFAARLPLSERIDAGNTKAILRRVALRLGVPPEIVHATTKRGLALPWARWTEERQEWARAAFAAFMRGRWREVFGLRPEGPAR